MSRVAQHPRIAGRGKRRQRGAVAVVVAIALAVLIGFVGLALDLGKLYVTRSELQNSADACALAAARDLTGATVNLSVSEAAGITAGHQNFALFQQNAVQLLTDSNVTFSDALTNPFLPKGSVSSPASIKYVKCTTAQGNIANWFIQALNVIPGINIANASVSAAAVATVGPAQTTCAIPVFVCKAGTNVSPPVAGASYNIGDWMASKTGSPPAYGAGNFGWAALDGSNSASEITKELTGNYCNLPAIGASVGSPGNKVSNGDAWNTRFGIYHNPFKGPADGTPDFTGWTYNTTTWLAGRDAYADFVAHRRTFASYQGDATTGITTSGSYTASNYTAGADRRLVLAPEVDCTQLLSGHSAPVLQWDCMLMLDPMGSGGGAGPVHLEYRGSSSMTGSPCATEGVPGNLGSVGPMVPVLLQ
ncbi:pilus assembly protein TadG-related protein [Burkholderia ubonensis]|uniref:Pilus assembly protein TadG n=1 Tax=Burkholderia ubonensis TaxID=101571 RepID=A0ABD6Q2H6_9BURK|nr:pilus assembly protein TadG-related protein [Burkholderia ubonensis]KVT44859.1 pilus assembly protein TadG [Burkholderia ubonensis]KVX87131.1 pilus assembly protein TadG [Burkholderia ubonensis]OJA46246.1 pilus assembly protein TadG [Burkholderia ubonensis]